MLKSIFWLLLIANVALFALERGYLDAAGIYSNGREPGRVANQLQADKIKLVPAIDPDAHPAAAESAPTETAPAAAPVTISACTEIGNFSAGEARRFASQWSELAPTVPIGRREIKEIGSYRVYLPSLGSKEAADKKIEELRGLGIKDFFVITDAPNIRYGISLGILKTEEAAQTQVAMLGKKGLVGTRIEPRNATMGKVAFQLRDLNTQSKAAFDKIVANFTGKEITRCD
ncbi:SPOR domain-containing protein [Glaciimonas sp. GG7]